MKISTLLGKSRVLLAVVVMFTAGLPTASGETIFEDFENLTLVNQNGDPLTSSWSFGYGLSNGWKIVGGTIYGSAGSADYGLVKDTGKGWNDSNYYLEASYGRTNSAYVFIPKQLQGIIKFYAKSNLSTNASSSYTSTVKVYEADADGTVSSTLLYEKTLTKGGNWLPCIIEGVQGKYIAINLVRANLDDFEAEVGDGSGVIIPDKKALTITDFQVTTEMNYSNPIVANEENMFTAEFAVTVKNSGNVELAATEVKVQIEDADKNVFATATASEPLAAGDEVTIPVSVTTNAGELGSSNINTFTFYARERIGNIRFSTNRYVYVTPYAAKFDIKYDGWTLDSGETISFGTTNTSTSRTITLNNSGTAPLTISSIALPEGFTADETAFVVEAGGSKTVTLTLTPAAPYGQKDGNVTISHTLGEFTFAVTGTTVDPEKFFVNFEDKQFPSSWTVGEKWSVTSQSGNYYAHQTSNAEATAIVTQKLTVAEGETMTFEAKRAYSYNAATLTVSFSADQETWSLAGSYDLSSAFTTYTISTIPAGDYYLKFEGQYVAIDNIAGFTEAGDAPVLGVYVGETALDNGTTLDFELVNEDTNIILIVKNDGTGTLNAAVSVSGEGFSVNKESVSLVAGESTDIIVTMAAEPWGIKAGTLTIGDMTFALEGESRDPEILFVDFEDGQWPAGWTPGYKWSIYQNMAEHYDYECSETDLITAKLRVEEGMALQFDAKRSSETYTSSLKVRYSTDKTVWFDTEGEIGLTADMTTYTVDLPEGDYYVMFLGTNVDIDNITGVKLSTEVDHIVFWEEYDIPAEGMVNNEYTAYLTLKNEGVDGEEVSVRFYLDGEIVFEETTVMDFNETHTFTYTFTPQKALETYGYFEVQYAGLPEVKSQSVDISIKAEEGEYVTLTGTITDKETHEKLANAVVTLKCGDITYSGISDNEGRYEIKVYKNGPAYMYTVTVVKNDYEDYTTSFYVNGLGEDTVEENFQLTINYATAINDIEATTTGNKAYNLGGQRVEMTAKGLYIVNGKIIIKK